MRFNLAYTPTTLPIFIHLSVAFPSNNTETNHRGAFSTGSLYSLPRGRPSISFTALRFESTGTSNATSTPSTLPAGSRHAHPHAAGQHLTPPFTQSASTTTIVLVALTLLAVVLGLAKFVHSYWTTPRRAQTTALDIERRQCVEREVLQQLALGREGLLFPPPPPYFPRPPSYVEENPVKPETVGVASE
ncbi:hypothetical protein B0H11DRAFT_1200136 [Mycena galericulata]|nr:hypothetical protein B0H11DRAFT_1200136 [Mycena galericulata]